MNIENFAYKISTKDQNVEITPEEKSIIIHLFQKDKKIPDFNPDNPGHLTELMSQAIPDYKIRASTFRRGSMNHSTGKRISNWRIVIENERMVYAGSGHTYARALLCAILRTQS